jgi:DNA-binding NtrC family response regulator
MGPGLQAKLLRVLENGHYRRVGSTKENIADVRIIAATNKNLEDEQKAGHFREDLYYRLNVVSIQLPTLCERREAIPELVQHFLTSRQIGPKPLHLPENITAKLPAATTGSDPRQLHEVERRHVLEILRQEKGNKVHPARVLGISRRALYRLIEKYHLAEEVQI